MVKLYDIARKLNIAPSTVSKALNGKGRISSELREKIMDLANEMNYHPNEYARGLKTKKSTMIGVILPDISNIFYGKMLKGIDNAAREKGYTVLYCDSDENLNNEKSYYELLSSRNVCGMIIAPAGLSDIYSNVGIDENIVFIDSMPQEDIRQQVITIDNYKAAYELTEHLISRGYTRSCMICGTISDTTTGDRVRGFEDCMKVHGLEDQAQVVTGQHSFEGGKTMMASLLSGQRPEAVITENNFLAYGALSVIREKGLRVPDDVAIACFDGIDDFDTMFINLTTVIQPIEEIGRGAVELIICRNEGQPIRTDSNKIIVAYTLHIGDST